MSPGILISSFEFEYISIDGIENNKYKKKYSTCFNKGSIHLGSFLGGDANIGSLGVDSDAWVGDSRFLLVELSTHDSSNSSGADLAAALGGSNSLRAISGAIWLSFTISITRSSTLEVLE